MEYNVHNKVTNKKIQEIPYINSTIIIEKNPKDFCKYCNNT